MPSPAVCRRSRSVPNIVLSLESYLQSDHGYSGDLPAITSEDLLILDLMCHNLPPTTCNSLSFLSSNYPSLYGAAPLKALPAGGIPPDHTTRKSATRAALPPVPTVPQPPARMRRRKPAGAGAEEDHLMTMPLPQLPPPPPPPPRRRAEQRRTRWSGWSRRTFSSSTSGTNGATAPCQPNHHRQAPWRLPLRSSGMRLVGTAGLGPVGLR